MNVHLHPAYPHVTGTAASVVLFRRGHFMREVYAGVRHQGLIGPVTYLVDSDDAALGGYHMMRLTDQAAREHAPKLQGKLLCNYEVYMRRLAHLRGTNWLRAPGKVVVADPPSLERLRNMHRIGVMDLPVTTVAELALLRDVHNRMIPEVVADALNTEAGAVWAAADWVQRQPEFLWLRHLITADDVHVAYRMPLKLLVDRYRTVLDLFPEAPSSFLATIPTLELAGIGYKMKGAAFQWGACYWHGLREVARNT